MTTTLGEVCTIIMGQAPTGDSYNDRGEGMPLIAGAGDFKGDTLAPTKFTTKPGKVSNAGDVILSIRASIGAKVWARGEYCLGRGVAGLRPGPKLDRKYLWHWLTRYERELASKGRGATFLQVNKADISEMSIVVPPLPEQRRIAAILDHADALRTKRRQVLAHLDRLTQSLFFDTFGHPRGWPGRWPMTTVGRTARSVTYGTAAKAGSSGAFPILRMGNVTDEGRLDLRDLKHIDLEPSEEERYLTQRGDMLFNRTNSLSKVGKAAVVRTDRQLAIAGYLVRVRFDDAATAEFVAAYLRSPTGIALRRSLAKAAVNQANISAGQMKNMPIAAPPLDVQQQFAAGLRSVEANREVMQRSAAAADDLISSLQSRAFRGEL